jgi:hypothetical protein
MTKSSNARRRRKAIKFWLDADLIDEFRSHLRMRRRRIGREIDELVAAKLGYYVADLNAVMAALSEQTSTPEAR